MATSFIGLGSPSFTTASGSKTVTFGAATRGETVIVFAANTGNVTNPTVTDDNASGTYTVITTALTNTSADLMVAYARNAPFANTASTIITMAPGTTTGGGLWAIRLVEMTKFGTASVVQSARQENQASGTPAPVFGATPNLASLIVGAVFNATGAASQTPPTNYTEATDVGYTVPTAGLECVIRSYNETNTTITWGAAAGSAFCSIILELDCRVPIVSMPPRIAA